MSEFTETETDFMEEAISCEEIPQKAYVNISFSVPMGTRVIVNAIDFTVLEELNELDYFLENDTNDLEENDTNDLEEI